MEPYYNKYADDVRMFTANFNSSTESYNSLVGAEITTDKIRIHPKSHGAAPAMRVEVDACVYGCKV